MLQPNNSVRACDDADAGAKVEVTRDALADKTKAVETTNRKKG